MPKKYINVPTQAASPKNTPANNAITGNLAPQGINGVNIAVVLLCLSFLIVLVAMIPGIAQPVPIIIGIIDLPDKPTLLKYLSITTATRAMYPQSSNNANKKNNTIIKGKNPTTATTPPIIPSTSSAFNIGDTESPRDSATKP